MKISDNKLLENLIIAGAIGGALVALVSKYKIGSTLRNLASSAILASYTASKAAKNSKLPTIKLIGNNLVEEDIQGNTKILKTLPVLNKNLPKYFKLSK